MIYNTYMILFFQIMIPFLNKLGMFLQTHKEIESKFEKLHISGKPEWRNRKWSKRFWWKGPLALNSVKPDGEVSLLLLSCEVSGLCVVESSLSSRNIWFILHILNIVVVFFINKSKVNIVVVFFVKRILLMYHNKT